MDQFIKQTADLELMIATKKQQVADEEQNWLNFKKLSAAESYTVGELKKEKAELDGMVQLKTEQLEVVKADLFKAQEELTAIKSQSAVLNSQIKDINAKNELTDGQLKDREEAVSKREIATAVVASAVDRKLNELESSGKAFDAKVSTLKEILTTF